jgi:hypothetical protein
LQTLKRIQHHRVSINGAQPLSGVSSMTDGTQPGAESAEGQDYPAKRSRLSLL